MTISRLAAVTWLALALAVAAAITLVPLMVPVILAAWTATIARPLLDRLARALKGRSTAAAVIVFVLVLVGVAISILLVSAVVTGSTELYALVSQSPSAQAALEAIVSPGGEGDGEGAARAPRGVPELITWLQSHSAEAFKLIGGVAGAAAKSIIGAVIFFFGTWTFLVDGPRAWLWAQEHLPVASSHLRRMGAAFTETGRGLLIGVGLTNASQAVTAIIIYVSLGIPRAVVLGLLTGLAAFVPLGGAALIWAPVSAGLYFTDQPVKAVVMLALGVVLSTMDNVLRPIFARYGKLDLPVFLLFLSVFGGLVAWGPFGALLGPLIVRLAIEALQLLREEREAQKNTSSSSGGPSQAA